MSNLKILYNNVADSATISASTTAGSLAASNLLTDIKSDVWRSTSTSATITLTWAASQLLSGVVFPFCNLTSTSTFRIKVYTNVADASPVVDTGAVLACANSPLGLWSWGSVPLGVNAYSYGGASYGVGWFTPTSCKKITIDIVDTLNPSGYIEASRVVTGSVFTPENDAELNVDFWIDDRSVEARSGGGDLRMDIGTSSKGIKFNLSNMNPSDRLTVASILKGNGKYKPLYVSLFPSDADPAKEQQYQIYGKLSGSLSIGHSNWNLFGCPVEIVEN